MKRTYSHHLALLTLALLPACSSSGPGDARALNVLIITLDTTRPDRMSAYDYGRPTTPSVAAIAADGARFDVARSTAGITPMSHSSILTGLNNYEHGMRVFYSEEVSHRLKDSVDTLPEILARRGWATGASVSSYPVSEVYNLDQGFEFFETGLDLDGQDFSAQQKHAKFWHEGEKSNTQRRGDSTVNDALAWLEEREASRPWCLWVHMFDVHDFSVVPPKSYAEQFIDGFTEYPLEVKGTSGEWREKMYDPEMRFQDAQVGRLVEWLEAKGQYDNTIIVVTADHGQGLEDGAARHGWRKHRLLYDWSVRVPMVVRIPGEEPGQVLDTPVRTIDIVPTVLDALSIPPRQPVEGRSMLPLLRGEQESEPRMAYADALNKYDTHSPRRGLPAHSQGENLYMVCDGRWKLIWHELRGQHELFDLEHDPLELKNLAEVNHDEVERLKKFLDERRAFDVEPPSSSEHVDSSALEGLGYGGGDEDEQEDE